MAEHGETSIESIESSEATFPVVGIGASAGGLEALEQFFDNMPATHEMAFVVVQHLSPDFKSFVKNTSPCKTGACVRVTEGIRTPDPRNHNPVL